MPVTAQEFDAIASAYSSRIEQLSKKVFSDTLDDNGLQYVDLVMEGGGTLGVSLLGYTYVLEQAGIRFLGIAGTSAGAISAVALAAAGRPSERRVDRLLAPLANIPLAEFIDGKDAEDSDAQDVVETWLRGKSAFKKALDAVQVIDNIKELLALNRGDAFSAWLEKTLKALNGGQDVTVASLQRRMTDAPRLLVRHGTRLEDFAHLPERPFKESNGRWEIVLRKERPFLSVIAADIATETKLELPRMAGLLWEDPSGMAISALARASMAIPGFFAPVWVERLPLAQALERWGKLKPGLVARRKNEDHFLPTRHCLVDGGLLSNFPIDVFHSEKCVPLRPTFGAKLQWDETAYEVEDIVDVLRQCFNSARHALDTDFIDKNPDFSELVTYIDTGDISWLDFHLSDAHKKRLFQIGVESALAFLEKFDWEKYKEIRRQRLVNNVHPA